MCDALITMHKFALEIAWLTHQRVNVRFIGMHKWKINFDHQVEAVGGIEKVRTSHPLSV